MVQTNEIKQFILCDKKKYAPLFSKTWDKQKLIAEQLQILMNKQHDWCGKTGTVHVISEASDCALIDVFLPNNRDWFELEDLDFMKKLNVKFGRPMISREDKVWTARFTCSVVL